MDYQFLQSLPTKPGAYLFKDSENKVLYVGKAKNIKKRVASYFRKDNIDLKISQLIQNSAKVDYVVVNSEIEAFLLEANLIRKHKPFYNIKLIDDKSYPLVKISKSKIPYIIITRKKNEKNADYFGPYTNTGNLKSVLNIIRKIFPFQSVKNHSQRKCLYYHLHLCPCIQANPQNLKDYKKTIIQIRAFLNGKTSSVISSLKKEQNQCVKNEEFERAQEIQNKINQINFITSKFYDPFSYVEKPNFYFERISEELVFLKNSLMENGMDIKNLIRIECYDISNFQGTNATASMIVFLNGDSSKNEYRRFKIRSKKTPDDFLMLREVITRRFKHKEWDMPDLIVVDGGKGQVSSVFKILGESGYNLPVIGLAKREETIVIPLVSKRFELEFVSVKLPLSNPGINLLRRLRDEAHRFAITYHRNLRKKEFLS